MTLHSRFEDAPYRCEDEHEEFFEHAPVALRSVGADGRIIRANQAELEMLGYSAQEYMGRFFAEFHVDACTAQEVMRRIDAGETLRNFPARLICKNGSIKDVLIDVKALWREGRLVHTLCVTREAAPPAPRAEHVLDPRAQHFRAAIDKVLDGFIIYDSERRFTFVNAAWLTRSGMTMDLLLNRRDEDVFPQNIADLYVPAIERARRTGELQSTECTLTFPSGTFVMQISYVPVLDGQGRVQQILGLAHDITELRRAERTLRESEERLQAILDNVLSLVYLKDRHGRYFMVNRHFLDTVGVPREEILGKTDHDIFAATFADIAAGNDRAAWKAGRAMRFEEVIEHFDGRRIYISIKFPLRDASGVPYALCGVSTDITQLRHAEQVLRDSEERLRLALQAGGMGTWEWDITADRVLWSPALEAIHGLAPGTFAGDFDAFKRDICPEDLESVLDAIRRTLESGEDHKVEYRLLWPDGTVRWVEGRGKLFRDPLRKPLRMVGVCMDVTERKRAEQALRFMAQASTALAGLVDYQSALQRVAFLAVPAFADWCAIDMVDAEGGLRRLAVAHVDPAKAELAHELHRRYPPDAAAKVGTWNIVRTGHSELLTEIPESVLLAQTRGAEHLRILRELGLKSYMGVPLMARGTVIGVLTFVSSESGRRYDMNDLVVAEDLANRAAIAIESSRLYGELKESDRRKDEFLATLAHELRNPLAPLRNALNVIELAGQDAQVVQQSCGMMQRQLRQMVRLVDDLLDLARINTGKIALTEEQVELGAIIKSALETSRPLMDERGHTLSVELPAAPVWLHADAIRLAQVFFNLINNACKYTEPGGHIAISAEPRGDEVVVKIKDDGVGIAPEMLPRIFNMFAQVSDPLVRTQAGLGIGLSLARRLIELHGGSIEAHSAGCGLGSEFTVRLPVHASPLGHVAGGDEDGAAHVDAVAPGKRILVVDDNVDAADSLAMLLRMLDHDVSVAYDGFQALEAVAAYRPSIMFLDIGLPRLDGYEVARRIRAAPQGERIRLIALTGWGQEVDRRRSQDAGFDHHLTKPVEFEIVQSLLQQDLQ